MDYNSLRLLGNSNTKKHYWPFYRSIWSYELRHKVDGVWNFCWNSDLSSRKAILKSLNARIGAAYREATSLTREKEKRSLIQSLSLSLSLSLPQPSLAVCLFFFNFAAMLSGNLSLSLSLVRI